MLTDWTLIIELSIHRQIITPLHRNRASCTNLVRPNRHSHAHLPRHASTADNRLIQLQSLDHLPDRPDIRFFIVRMVPWDVVASRKGAAMGGQIKRDHGTLLTHARIVHHAVVLTAITPSGVEEDDLLWSVARGLVEDLRAAPDGGVDVDVLACEVVFVGVGLLVFFQGTVLSVAEEFEETGGEVAVLREFGLAAVEADSLLLDVHALGESVSIAPRMYGRHT